MTNPTSTGPNECPNQTATPIEYKPALYSTKISDIESRDLVWFWDNKIPDYGMTMIQGDPGVSKSFLSLDIAAHVSTGTSFTDCPDVRVEKGSVLLLNGEDDPARIKERCEWAHANMDNIRLLKGCDHYIDIRQHIPDIQLEVDEINSNTALPNVRLLLIDPISSYIGTCKQNDNNEVRNALEPLSDFAVKNKLCIIIINHMNKKQGDKHVYRGLGSMGFTAVCRSVWGVIFDKDDKEYKLMLPVKTNYSIRALGLKYRIIDDRIMFDSEPYYGDIDEQDNETVEKTKSKSQDCVEFLSTRIPFGRANRVSSAEIKKETEDLGFSYSAVQSAKTKLGIISTKARTSDGGWFMHQPDNHIVMVGSKTVNNL